MQRWEFEIKQGGMIVASGDCPNKADALREAAHYVFMYGQDGPLEVAVKKAK